MNSQLQSKYLGLYLTNDIEVLIKTSHLSEIVYLEDDKITPVFSVHPAIMGVFSLRGEIIGLVDIAFLLGLPPLSSYTYLQNYSILLIKQETKSVALACYQVGKLYLAQDLQPSQNTLTATDTSPNFDFCLIDHQKTADGIELCHLDYQKILDLLNN